jgi:hypothetical protein
MAKKKRYIHEQVHDDLKKVGHAIGKGVHDLGSYMWHYGDDEPKKRVKHVKH